MGDRPVLCVLAAGANPDLCTQLKNTAWEVHAAEDLRAAEHLLNTQRFHVGLIVFPEINDSLCSRIDQFLRAHGGLEWVGAFDSDSLQLPACRELVLEHLFDHHTLPIDSTRLAQTLGHAYGHAVLREAVPVDAAARETSPIVGRSTAIAGLHAQIRRVAKVDAAVLISGESGSGKELTAQAIHRASRRATAPFVPVNCGAIPASLIQSELFGHARGAFTGAARDKRGFIEAAAGGTLFLDEIGDLSLDLQVALLRFLQESTITRVGSTQSVRVDVRVIAATNVDLEQAVRNGSFREDLYYRLNVLPLRVPPLRERKGDIELLAHHFFNKFLHEKNPCVKGYSRMALATMEAHQWPGNIRELINRVRRALVLADGRLIRPSDLGFGGAEAAEPRAILDSARVEAERSAIAISLRDTGKNVTEAAKRLGVSRMTLYRLMAKHGISH